MSKDGLFVALAIGAGTFLAVAADKVIDAAIDAKKEKKIEEKKPAGYQEAVDNLVEAANKLGAFTAPVAEETSKIPQFSQPENIAPVPVND